MNGWIRSHAMVLGVIVLLLSGCQSQTSEVYGESEGADAESSPSGMSIFRLMTEKRGHPTYTVRSLSPANMERLETLVWCPDAFPNHQLETYQWLSEWFAKGNKTLIYIGRDFSPTAAYWSEIAARERARTDANVDWLKPLEQSALANAQLDERSRAARKTIITPWNQWVVPLGEMERVNEFSGAWASELEAQNTHVYCRSYPIGFDESRLNAMKSELDWEPDPTTTVNKSSEYERVWQSSDSLQRTIAKDLDGTRLSSFEELLATGDGRTLIAELNGGPLSSSTLFVVANNSFFSNYGLIRAPHRAIAATMIDGLPMGGVGFLTGQADPQIRQDDSDERQRGFEMLTVWPLNVVTIHAAFLGVAAMIAAFPIFGRPSRTPKPSHSDFRQHIDAVGDMMQRSGDKEYAVRVIADYFRNVRKDPSSPWAHMDQTIAPTQSPFQTPVPSTTVPLESTDTSETTTPPEAVPQPILDSTEDTTKPPRIEPS